MPRLTFVFGALAGFALAVVLRFALLGNSGGAEIKLASAAPPIPVLSASSGDGAPAATGSFGGGIAKVPSASNAPTADPLQQASGDGSAHSVPVSGQPPAAAPPVAAAPDAPFHFVGDPSQSSAKILVTETSVLGDSLLVANGSNVTGDFYLTPTGQLTDSPSSFQLDLRTMKSNDSTLNSVLKNNLDIPTYPYAVFTVGSVSGIPASYTDGTEFNFTMSGTLTMHNVSRPITWTAKGRQLGQYLTFAADTDFNMTDFGWTPPNYGVAKARNTVHLQATVISLKSDAGTSASSPDSQARALIPAPSTSTGSIAPAPSGAPTLSQAPTLSSSANALQAPSSSGGDSLGGLGSLLGGGSSSGAGGLGALGGLLGGGSTSGAGGLGGLGDLLGGSGAGGLGGLGSLLGGGSSGGSGDILGGLGGLLGGGGSGNFNPGDLLNLLTSLR